MLGKIYCKEASSLCYGPVFYKILLYHYVCPVVKLFQMHQSPAPFIIFHLSASCYKQ